MGLHSRPGAQIADGAGLLRAVAWHRGLFVFVRVLLKFHSTFEIGWASSFKVVVGRSNVTLGRIVALEHSLEKVSRRLDERTVAEP